MADPTIIGAQTQVSGRISGDADLSVEGRVDGTIELSETLTIAEGGVVTGTVRARQVIIEGFVDGEVSAEERVVLSATARAVANILAPLVEMADGAQLRGELNIGVDAEAPTAARTPARTSQPTRSAPASTATTSASSRSAAPARTAAASTPSSTATQAAPSTTTTTTVVVEEEPEAEPEPVAEVESSAEVSEVTEVEALADAGVEADADIDPETIQEFEEDFTVKELKEQLRALDLPVSGTKSELIERLLQAQAQAES
ncbi:hypothetical protein FRC98_02360 [Lujinxingia vulgaris]|uniref:SAP domain-containing protein n=1 Tax=Lujinxingia vulgaris TaxID=2600176 RepID=A0A5C6XQ67_9DELT|nr:polymer-forming cytoskeletal protein [Lujinxingia vulgaris]TXD39529.1 hypothetical protein FRC98_02360 [Lujinxingia vulgaris]